ncbi:TraK family protein [Desulfovibrio sp. OttesenSCG-928-C14]|nr:TraK family protein [Desulfovibrio sp. OttesenSCG-928-C14]
MTGKPKVTPGRPGSARMEYFACREDVEALLAKGYSARLAYEDMQGQGRVTCSYSAFCDYVRGGGKRLHASGKKKAQTAFHWSK